MEDLLHYFSYAVSVLICTATIVIVVWFALFKANETTDNGSYIFSIILTGIVAITVLASIVIAAYALFCAAGIVEYRTDILNMFIHYFAFGAYIGAICYCVHNNIQIPTTLCCIIVTIPTLYIVRADIHAISTASSYLYTKFDQSTIDKLTVFQKLELYDNIRRISKDDPTESTVVESLTQQYKEKYPAEIKKDIEKK